MKKVQHKNSKISKTCNAERAQHEESSHEKDARRKK